MESTIQLEKEQQRKKKHPPGLYLLFFTEMWERFSYYGLRGLLTLYLTTALVSGGLGFMGTLYLRILYWSLLFHTNDWWLLNRPFSR